MADAADSKSAGGDIVWVQVPPSAFFHNGFSFCPFIRLFLIKGYFLFLYTINLNKKMI